MKDYLLDLVQAGPTPAQGRSIAREYIQARVLQALQNAGAMIPLAFHGGTALRFLYAIPRYSEDLDFALEGDPARYDFRSFLESVRSELSAEGYAIELAINDKGAVHSGRVRLPGLFYELGLSPHSGEVLTLKLEVDTHPPAGAGRATTIIRRHVVLHLQHHDRASLLAGKLHAVLMRPYVKGRDIYDLVWYLSDPNWPQPNLTMLNNALAQTGWTGSAVTFQNWRLLVRDRLLELAWDRVVSDVSPFLERAAGSGLLERGSVLDLLERREPRPPGH